ncbi:MAG: alpha-amylase family protein [Planctomycetota bacterium]
MTRKRACLTIVFCLMAAAVTFAQDAASSPARQPVPRSQGAFGVHFDLHPDLGDPALGADVNEEMIRKFLVRVKPDFVQYDCKGHIGYLGYPDPKIGPSAPHIVNDSLAIWRKVTREQGVVLLVHFSGLFDITAIAKHPDWAVVNADGKPDANATSVFGPYVDQVMIPQLKEAGTKYDLDGAWVDGECWAAKLDYSPAALAAWKKETGHDEAPKKRGEPNWLEWKQFHRKHLEQYVAHWVDAVHAACPKMQLASNWLYTTFVPKPVAVKVDYLSGDYDPLNSVDRGRVEARYLSSTGMPWDLLAWGFVMGQSGMSHNCKPAAHLQQEVGVVLMQGGGISLYYQPTRSGHVADFITETAGQVADFCRQRQAASFRSTSIPQVALLMSTAAIEDRSDSVGSTWGTFEELIGTLHALLELHYSVDIAAEHQITGRLSEYPMVVVPDFDRFAPGMQQELLAYVEKGGRMLLTGEKCARLFEPALGVKLEGEPKEAAAYLASPNGLVSINGIWQKVSLMTAEAAGQRYPICDGRIGGEVAATVNAHGKGRIGAIYGPVGPKFLRQHHPYLREFIGQVAAKVWPDPDLLVDGPPCLDVSLRMTKQGQIAVHLLNRANMPTSTEYSIIDHVPPVGPVGVTLRMNAKPRSVQWVPGDKDLKWSWADGTLKATVPSVDVHGVVVVEP